MIKTVSKIGNSQGIIFDSALMELAHLKVGDQVDVTVHDGGSITLVPMKPRLSPEDAADRTKVLIQHNDALFKRLS